MVGSAEPPAPVQSSEPLCSCLATQPTWERTQVQHSARRSPSPPLPTCFQVCYPVCTETGNVRMVERCGAFTHIMQPGLSFLICCVDEASNHVSMRLQQIKVTCETKTKDNVFTNIEVRLVLGARRPCAPHRSSRGGSGQRRRASQSQARPSTHASGRPLLLFPRSSLPRAATDRHSLQVSIQYQIKKEEAAMHSAYYRLSDPHRQIQSYVYDVVRSTVPKLDLDNVFLEKDEIAKQVAENLKENFGSFGYEILATPITAIEPAVEVKNAMNQINKARRVKEAAGDEGEANKTRAIKDAEASARSIEIHAKADAEALYLAGVGLARQRQAIMSGLRESVNAFGREIEGIDPKQVLDLMIVTQYFDMMQSIGKESRSNALFLNHSPSSLADLTQSVSRGFMSR